MSVLQQHQINIHSLFQAYTVVSDDHWKDDNDRSRTESENDNDDDESEDDHVPAFEFDFVSPNRSTDLNCRADDRSSEEEDDDEEEEEESITSTDSCKSDASSHRHDDDDHYSSRLEATRKLISDCVITARTPSSNLNHHRRWVERSTAEPLQEDTSCVPLDDPRRSPDGTGNIMTFDSVRFVSPTYSPHTSHRTMESTIQEYSPKSSSLSSMIHSMSQSTAVAKTPRCDTIKTPFRSNTKTPSVCTPLYSAERNRTFQDQQQYRHDDGNRKQQSAFQSSISGKGPIEYCLSTGKRMGMIAHGRQRSLPDGLRKVLLIDSSSVSEGFNVALDSKHNSSLSILLLECHQKVFEIVLVNHVTAETSVGDVISRARTQATDPRLAQQTYVSLCNSVHEMAAMMLPVHLMMMNQATSSRVYRKQRGDTTLQKYDRLEASRHCDDPSLGRLLVAVPEGSTAETVRLIQKALWSHPRMQRWWQKENRVLEKMSGKGKKKESSCFEQTRSLE